jgi:RNA polymerase sigma factor for flagellar operon FliA
MVAEHSTPAALSTQDHPLWDAYAADRSIANRNALVEHYSQLIRPVAVQIRRRLPRSVELADLLSFGACGLIGAVEDFDTSRGVRFWTFAEQRVRGAIYDGLRRQDWVPRRVRASSPAEQITRVGRFEPSQHDRSPCESPTDSLDVLRAVCRRFNQTERLIIILYYYEELTMKEIGATLGISESRVCQIHASLLRWLKRTYRARRQDLCC